MNFGIYNKRFNLIIGYFKIKMNISIFILVIFKFSYELCIYLNIYTYIVYKKSIFSKLFKNVGIICIYL